jgi:hypothetical protein
MAETKAGLPDPANINFYGAQEADVNEYQKSLQDSIDALKQRYENPNWFNVAAGFFKPQLGGFAASLGSASQALGENLEKQRESQLPVAQMRAQLAASKIAMGQKKTAAEMADEAMKKPGGLSAEDVAAISHYDEPRGKILQQELTNQQALRKEIMEAHAAGRTDAELAAQYGPRFNLLYPQGTPDISAVPGAKVPGAKKGAGEINLDKPPMESGLTQAMWDDMPLTRKNQIATELAGANTENVLKAEQTLRSTAESAPQDISRLRAIRELGSAPGMEAVFGILQGNDVVSLAGKAISEGRLTERLANLEGILRQANITDPTILRNVAQLTKLINEQKMSGGVSGTATDQLRELQSQSNPSLENPQSAFLNLTDAIAHARRHHFDLWQTVSGNNPDKVRHNAYTFVGSDAWKPLNKAYAERHANIFNNPPKPDAPADIYDLTIPGKGTSAKPAPAAATAPAGKTTSPITLDALDAAIARKAAAKKGTP